MNNVLEIKKLDLARKMESNFIDWYCSAQNIDGALFIEDETATSFITGYPDAWMNCVLKFSTSPSLIDDKIQQTLKPFSQKRCPMSWFIGVHTDNSNMLKEALFRYGFADSKHPYIGMNLNLAAFSYSQAVPELKIEELTEPSKIADFLKPFVVSFSCSDAVRNYFGQYILSRLGKSPQEKWFVGYVNNVPVSISAFYISNEVIMLHSVATLPEFRGKGYAQRLVEASVAAALDKFEFPIILYAGDMSSKLYKRMGFSEVYIMQRYTSDNNKNASEAASCDQ